MRWLRVCIRSIVTTGSSISLTSRIKPRMSSSSVYPSTTPESTRKTPPSPALYPPHTHTLHTRCPLAFVPGTRFMYSLSTDVLGILLARATGTPLPDLLAERIFKPLDMQVVLPYVLKFHTLLEVVTDPHARRTRPLLCRKAASHLPKCTSTPTTSQPLCR